MATIKICDICGSPDGVRNCAFWVDRRMDAAGSMEDEQELFDLCIAHRLKAAMQVIDILGAKLEPNWPRRIIDPTFVECLRGMIMKTVLKA